MGSCNCLLHADARAFDTMGRMSTLQAAPTEPGTSVPWRRRLADPRMLLLAWPVLAAYGALGDGARMLGHPAGEGPGHIWVTWALADAFRLPGNTVDAPAGLAWVFPTDLTSRLATLLLRIPFGDVAAYNLVTVALLAFAGLAVNAVARELGLGRWASVAAGLFATAHPALLGYAADGRQDSLALGWAALLVHAWLRCVSAPSTRTALWLASSVLLLQLSSPNYLLALALPLAPLSLGVLARRRPARRALVLAAVASMLTTGPAAWALLHFDARAGTRLEADFLQGLPLTERLTDADWGSAKCGACELWRGALRMDVTDEAYDALVAPAILLREPRILFNSGDFVLRSFAPGARRHMGVVICALVAVALLLLSRHAVVAAGCGFVGIVLSLGYGLGNALPFSVPGVDGLHVVRVAQVLAAVPGLGAFGNYGVFAVLGHAALGVAAAAGVDALGRRAGRAALVAAIAITGWLAELQYGSATPLPLATTRMPLLEDLGPLSEDHVAKAGVLLVHRNLDLDRYLQTLHGHEIYSPWFNNDQRVITSHAAGAFLDRLEALRCPDDARLSTITALRADGVRWVLVAPALLTPEHRTEQVACLDRLLGEPVVVRGMRVYGTPDQPGATLGDPPDTSEGPVPRQGPARPAAPVASPSGTGPVGPALRPAGASARP
jgi:hypothetical protein